MDAKRQKTWEDPASLPRDRGEAPKATGGGTEAAKAGGGTESPARMDALMKEVVERENLKEALARVRARRLITLSSGSRIGYKTP
jgi:hypothetical protein